MATVLFLCVHNAGRSQMAEAIFNRIAKEQGFAYTAESAGTELADRVHPRVVEAMAEIGLDLSGKSPRLLTNRMVEQAERVITMGCAVDSEACPAVTLREVEDWGLPDPKDMELAQVGAIRDTIRGNVEALLRTLQLVTILRLVEEPAEQHTEGHHDGQLHQG